VTGWSSSEAAAAPRRSAQAPAHVQELLVQVDVLPLQAQDLAAPHPENREHDEHRVQPVVPSGLEQRPHLVDAEWLPLLLRGPRDTDERGDVLGQNLLPDRILQRGTKRGVHVLDRPRPHTLLPRPVEVQHL